MKFHPYAEVFPLIEGQEFQALVDNIQAHGLRDKITVFDGQILDGRNRFRACKKAGVQPEYREFMGSEEDALEFVISLNIHRRHLTESQRAMAAAKIAQLPAGQAKKKPANLPVSTQAEAASAMKVSERSVRSARKVIERGSKELQTAVESGVVAVSRAAAVVDLPKPKQLAAAQRPKDPQPEPPPPESTIPEEYGPELDDDFIERVERILTSDDKLAALYAELKSQQAEIAQLKLSRDQYQNAQGEAVRLLKKEQNRNARLMKDLGQLRKGRAA